VQTDGGCTKKPRIFETDGNYFVRRHDYRAPNNQFSSSVPAYAIWASDNTTQKIRGCITISSRPRLRHLEMSGYDLPVSLDPADGSPSGRQRTPVTDASGRTSDPHRLANR